MFVDRHSISQTHQSHIIKGQNIRMNFVAKDLSAKFSVTSHRRMLKAIFLFSSKLGAQVYDNE